MRKKGKREIATVQVRLYPSTVKRLKTLSESTGKTMARLVDEKIQHGLFRS